MCKVKHPSISWNYRGNTFKEFLCRNYFVISLEKLFWMIMDEWFGFRMIWQILLLNGYLITSTALGICLYHSPSSFGRGCPRIYLLSNYKHIIVCLSLQAPLVYWKLHPGLCAPVLLQHTHYNKCNIATDYKVQKRGSVSQANFWLKFGIFL